MITFYQHVYPVMDYADRAEKQRSRIMAAFRGANYPMQLVSVHGRTEHATLERLQWDAWQDGSQYYAYVHLKGITHPGDQCVADWAELLEYFAIDCWRRCREELDSGHLVGVNHQFDPVEHYSGNFFWIRADAVKTLPAVRSVQNPEHWLSRARRPLEWRSLHQGTVNHYHERYPAERYR